jgi:MFS family permease
MLGPSILTGAFFGQKDFGSILGIAQMVFAVGFAAGSSVFGLFVDKFGYTVAWSSEFVFVVICYSALISTAIGMTKLNRIKEKSLNDKIDKAS